MTDFTIDQKNAIYTRGSDLLVSAAAGSGKTAVLVERIINAVTDKVNPLDIDRLLIVTFTEQAATEMRLRINRRLNEILKSKPGNLNVKRQISLLSSASITTIHAFCRKIVQEHADALDLDPKFKIGEHAELLIIKQELMENLLEDEYSKENNTDLAALVEMYGNRYKDDSLRELIFEIHEFMFKSPWPFKRIDEYVEMYNPSNMKTLNGTVWISLFVDSIRTKLEGASFELRCAQEICLKPGGPDKYISYIDDDISDITLLIKALDKDIESAYPLFTEFEFTVKRLPPYKKNENIDEELKEAAKKIRSDARETVKKVISGFFSKPLGESLQDLINLYPILKSLVNIVVKFAKHYQIEKRDRNMLDFNDLEQFALKVLYTEDSDINNAELSDEAYIIQDMFDEILTDEYQDSNQIQELILSAVSKEGAHNRFMVGDIKQSIYRFRQAKPEIFIDKYINYARYADNADSAKVKINLFRNFRSRKNILTTINYLFCQLMSRGVGEIDYDENAALNFGANFPETDKNTNDAVEVYILETNAPNDDGYDEAYNDDTVDDTIDTSDSETEIENLTKTQAEAVFISRKIRELVDTDKKLYVLDESGSSYRPAEYRDIVILAASVKNIADTYQEEFKKYDIPLYVNTSGGYFKSLEVITILDVLHIIDNPKQDIHLISVLHSPIYGFTCDELVEIRAAAEKISFYDCLLKYTGDDGLKSKIDSFLSELYEFQKLAVFTPISELLWIIYDKTNYFEYAGAMHGGSVRKANLRALIERAVTYEDTRFKGLFHFLKYIEKLQLSKTDLSEAKIVTGSENVVKLMTIHSSKGLEFPIVFLSSLGTKFNMSDRKKSILLDADYGFGPDYIDLNLRIKYNTISRTALLQKSLNEELSEKLRVLYVALTRAKEKLILTGVINSYESKSPKWERLASLNDIKLPKHYMLKAVNFLDWIMPALLRLNKIEYLPYSDCEFMLSLTQAETSANTPSENLSSAAQADSGVDNALDYVREKLTWQYPDEIAKTLPSKISISEIKRLHYLEISGAGSTPFFTDDINFQMPAFMTEGAKSKASDIGTAIHTIMEHIDFDRHFGESEIKDFIHSLMEKNLIRKEDAQGITVNKIAAFLETDLAQRIRKSPCVKREAPFVIALKPNEIYFGDQYKNADENILLHGVIDLFFEENGGLVLVDYKSDYIPEGKLNEIVKKYEPQLAVYKKALTETSSLPVREVYLYLFSISQLIRCDMP